MVHNLKQFREGYGQEGIERYIMAFKHSIQAIADISRKPFLKIGTLTTKIIHEGYVWAGAVKKEEGSWRVPSDPS